MRIQFAIMTCPAQVDRVATIVKAWAPPGTTLLHDDLPGIEKGYHGTATKFLWQFRNNPCESDWFVFADNDAFVYVERLKRLLETYPSSIPLAVGRVFKGVENVAPQPCTRARVREMTFVHGHCLCLNKLGYERIRAYLVANRHVPFSRWSDVATGMWCDEAGVVKSHNERFRSEAGDMANFPDLLKTAVSFHYLKPDDIKILLSHLP